MTPLTFVELDDADVPKSEPRLLEHLLDAEGGPEEQLVERVCDRKGEISCKSVASVSKHLPTPT